MTQRTGKRSRVEGWDLRETMFSRTPDSPKELEEKKVGVEVFSVFCSDREGLCHGWSGASLNPIDPSRLHPRTEMTLDEYKISVCIKTVRN